MHIAFVLAGLGAGGAERVVSLIASRWVARGWRVSVIAFDAAHDPVYHAFDPRVALVRLGLPPARGMVAGLAVNTRRLSALRRTLRRLQPDIAVAFLTKINVLTLAATTGLGLPVVVSERNNPRRQSASPGWNRLLAALYPRASAIVMQTRASLSALPARVRNRAVVIPNPIAAPEHATSDAQRPVIVAVGRLTPQKGFDLLLKAFARCALAHPDWWLTIWGEGPSRLSLEKEIITLGLEDRASMPGLTSTPGGWAVNASIFVLPSRFEGFPNVLGEAMAAGLPSIAFDCAFGPGEMIGHDMDGLLVADGDVDGLAQALDRLMADGALRDRLAKAAKVSARRFAIDRVVSRWDEVIRDVASRAQRRGVVIGEPERT